MMNLYPKFLPKALVLGLCAFSVGTWAETTVTIEKKKNDAFYSPFGKRDPFRVPTVGGLGEDQSVAPLQRFHVDQFKLKAILRGIGEAKAMFQDPRGKSHIVVQGDLIGIERATVSRIIKSEVILTERTYNYLGKESLLERVIALPQESELDPLQLVGDSPSQSESRNPAEARPQPKPTPTPTPTSSDTTDPSLRFSGDDPRAQKPSFDSQPVSVPTTPFSAPISATPVLGSGPQTGPMAPAAPTPVTQPTATDPTAPTPTTSTLQRADATTPMISPNLEVSVPDSQKSQQAAPMNGVLPPATAQ